MNSRQRGYLETVRTARTEIEHDDPLRDKGNRSGIDRKCPKSSVETVARPFKNHHSLVLEIVPTSRLALLGVSNDSPAWQFPFILTLSDVNTTKLAPVRVIEPAASPGMDPVL